MLIAALLIEYTPSPLSGLCPSTEDMFMIEPDLLFFICFITILESLNAAFTLISIILLKSFSSAFSSLSKTGLIPALLTSMSILSYFFIVVSIRFFK